MLWVRTLLSSFSARCTIRRSWALIWLMVAGRPVEEWAKESGTPCYLYDKSVVKKKIALLRDVLPQKIRIFYAMVIAYFILFSHAVYYVITVSTHEVIAVSISY